MALAFSRSLVKVGDTGLALDSLRRGTPWLLSWPHLQRESYTITDQKQYM
jgi:hypothetical protein